MPAQWSFKWYQPDQDIRPAAWLVAIGIVPPATPPIPYTISDRLNQRRVRFRSFLGGSGPPYTAVNQDIPFIPGSRLKFVNVSEAAVDLKVLYTAGTQKLLWAQLKDLPYIFNPLRGEGILEVTNPNNQVRQLKCVCISGFKIDESSIQEKSLEVTLSFIGNNPYWYSTWSEAQVTFTGTAVGTLPILPCTLVRGLTDIRGSFTLTNDGDVDSTSLTILINGPYKNPILENTSLRVGDKRYIIDTSDQGGINTTTANPITINFQEKSILKLFGTPQVISNILYTLTLQSRFWSVKKGVNTINLSIIDTTINTRVTIFFQSAYSTMI